MKPKTDNRKTDTCAARNPSDHTSSQRKAPSGRILHSVRELTSSWSLDLPLLEQVESVYPFRASQYFADLIELPDDPLAKQILPDPAEFQDCGGFEDPLAEEHLSPVPNLVHRYPNRVLWLVSDQCAIHCRFCTRKRRWSHPAPLTEKNLMDGLRYIASHPEIKDVLLSGGDPLLLSTALLEKVLASLRRIRHVEVIRIGTRVPSSYPIAVTPELPKMIARYHPVYMNIHFNHPREITPQSRSACIALADAGIPLGSQTVLLKGVNDQADVLAELFHKLLAIRVRPYYLMQMDLTRATEHFRTPLSRGLQILKSLRNNISGLAMPHFVVDLPGGYGKIPLLPGYIESISDDHLVLRNYMGSLCHYPLLPGESSELGRWLSSPVKPAPVPI